VLVVAYCHCAGIVVFLWLRRGPTDPLSLCNRQIGVMVAAME